jgi:SAM-dependent methyltransferase
MAAIRELPPVDIPGHKASNQTGADHPMRVVTRRAAGLDDGGWTDEVRRTVTENFDNLAAEWHTRSSPERTAVVVDALDRGLAEVGGGTAPAGGHVVEIGSGIGTYTELLSERLGPVLAVDLSMEMLRLAPAAAGQRVRADASRLPVRDGAAPAVVLILACLFPAEVDRVLAPDGTVVWVNSSGEQTPIHLPAADVVAALPGEWDGVAGRAGVGTWCVLQRAVPSPG